MKLFLVLLFITTTSFAATAPFHGPVEDRLNALEAGTSITAGSINATHIATGGVATAEILNATIIAEDFATGAVGTAAILDNDIVAGDIATGGVATAEILDATITADDLATGSVATAEILDGTILEADVAAQTGSALYLKRIARAVLDCGNGSGCPVGATSLAVSLPAKALIMRSWIYVVTQLADTGTCTVAIHCEDANNIKTATDITGNAAGAFIEGQSTGAVSTAIGSINAACVMTATVADGGSCVPTAGKVIVFVEYIVGE